MWLLKELWDYVLAELGQFAGRELTETAKRRPMEAGISFKSVLGAALPFIGGGLTPLITGAIGSGLGLFGGGEQPQAAGGYMPAGGGGSLADYLQQQAFMDAFREAVAGGPGETFNVQGALGRAQSRQQQQTGGMRYPATARPSLLGEGLGAGGGGGEGRGDGGVGDWWNRQQERWGQRRDGTSGGFFGKVPTEAISSVLPTTGTLYQQAQRRALAGLGGLPQNIYQGAMSQGLGTINRQAQLGREQLRGTLGQRGMLTSGLMGGGLGQLESGRLGAIGGYTSELQLSGLAAARSAQERSMNLYMQQLEAERNRQLQRELQGRAISAGEPDFYDYAGMAAGTLGSLYALRNIAPGSYSGIPSSQLPYTLPPI